MPLDGLVATQQLLHGLAVGERASAGGYQPHSPLPPFLQRQYASWEEPPGGPPESKIRAVPFTVTPYEAEQTFDEHHAKSWLHKRPSGGLQKVKEAYLPFWVSSALLRSHLHSAEIGRQGWTQVYNPQTRRFEQQLRMHYQQVAFDVIFEKQFTAEDEGSAVYASYKYPRSSIKALAPGDAVRMATHFTPNMVQQASGFGSVRRVGPFQMRPAAGASVALGWYKQQAWREARKWVMDQVECDDVRSLYLEHTVVESRTSPIYIPAYIFRSRHLGDKVHTFVSGCVPGRAAGTHLLDEVRVGALAGGAVSIGLLVTEAWKWAPLSSLLWLWVAPAALLAAVVTRLWPALSLQLSRARQARQREQAAADQHPWDDEFVAAFDPNSAHQQRRQHVYTGGYYDRAQPEPSSFEDFFRRVFGQQSDDTRQRQQRQQQQQRSQRPRGEQPRRTGDPRDPLGHYKRLGVDPGCSKDEIQAAFRGQAQKWHPDHVDDPAQKAEASRQFRAILESYQVLRDEERRRQYDRGIY